LARFLRIVSWVGLVALVLVLLHQNLPRQEREMPLAFGEFMQKVENDQVESLTISPKNIGTGRLSSGTRYVVDLPADRERYLPLVQAKIGEKMEVQGPSVSDVWVSGLIYLVITGLVLLVFWWALVRRQTERGGQPSP